MSHQKYSGKKTGKINHFAQGVWVQEDSLGSDRWQHALKGRCPDPQLLLTKQARKLQATLVLVRNYHRPTDRLTHRVKV